MEIMNPGLWLTPRVHPADYTGWIAAATTAVGPVTAGLPVGPGCPLAPAAEASVSASPGNRDQ